VVQDKDRYLRIYDSQNFGCVYVYNQVHIRKGGQHSGLRDGVGGDVQKRDINARCPRENH
jgi:hypothetical protein